MIGRWASWATGLRQRHARLIERRGIGMTVLQRSLPVSLTHVAIHRSCAVAVAPRISVALHVGGTDIRVIESVEHERTVVLQKSPGRFVDRQVSIAQEPPTVAATQASLARRSFVNRLELVEQSLRVLRRADITQEMEGGITRRRSTSELALEHVTLLKRRLQREESTLAIAVRQVRQNVAKQTPVQPAATEFGPPAGTERSRVWPATAPPPLPTLDSISDHVLQQIDRKLVAHRERMGRV